MPVVSAAVLIMGLSGIVAQLALLRELLITFQSNELSIGVTLANWLLLEAAGSFILGRVIEVTKDRILAFTALTWGFSLSFPLCVFLARTGLAVLDVAPGEAVSLPQIFIASFLILLPVSVCHGALFTGASGVFASLSRRDAADVGRVYVLETIGTLCGGLVFSSLLVTRLTAFQIALGVSLANFAVCTALLWYPLPGVARTRLHRVLAGFSLLLAGLAAFAAFGPPAARLQETSIRRQWGQTRVVHYENSRYGNVAVARREEQYTFFSDGVPVITAPTPDLVFTEEFSHLPLLFHPRPRELLVLGGGAGGVLRELLRHPVERVDYAELDPLILRLVRRFATPLTRAELEDPRVAVHERDGRLFLRETARRYDAVLIGVSNPRDLQTNRFFTREFFSLVRQRLRPDGIVALTLPGSTTYLSRELRDLNACISNTLRRVYPAVRVVPGDGFTILLASPSPGLNAVGTEQVVRRFQDAHLAVAFLTPFQIEEKLAARRSRWFEDSLAGATRYDNEDFRPLGVYYSLSQWNAMVSPRLQRFFARVETIGFLPLALGILLLAAVLLLFSRPARRRAGFAMPLAIGFTGFAGMIFELALIFTFQALYGVVFFWGGLLITAFMGGTALGAFFVTARLGRLKKERAHFLHMEGALILFSAGLPLVFLLLRPYLDHPLLTGVVTGLFLVLSAAAGFLTGLEFPLANRIHPGSSSRVGATAGLIYAADLLGGWAGGIAGGVFLLPILGLTRTCLLVGLLKTTSLLVVAGSDFRSGAE